MMRSAPDGAPAMSKQCSVVRVDRQDVVRVDASCHGPGAVGRLRRAGRHVGPRDNPKTRMQWPTASPRDAPSRRRRHPTRFWPRPTPVCSDSTPRLPPAARRPPPPSRLVKCSVSAGPPRTDTGAAAGPLAPRQGPAGARRRWRSLPDSQLEEGPGPGCPVAARRLCLPLPAPSVVARGGLQQPSFHPADSDVGPAARPVGLAARRRLLRRPLDADDPRRRRGRAGPRACRPAPDLY
jgi:hypothetical protein